MNTVASLVGETDKRLWRMLNHYVKKAREQVDMSCVKAVGIDETSSRRGITTLLALLIWQNLRLYMLRRAKVKRQ